MTNHTKKVVSFFTALMVMFSLVLPSNLSLVQAAETDNGTVNIQVLSTTDVHGKFKNYSYPVDAVEDGGMTQIATLVKQAVAENPNTLIVDNGDAIQGNYNHLFTTNDYIDSGKRNPMALSFNTIGYDAISLGNHEFNFGMDYLQKYASEVKDNGTSVLCANLYKGDERVFEPYIINEYEGVRVAVIGVVTPHITRWDATNLKGYEPTNPAEEVQKVIAEIKAKDPADVYVVTAHVGLTEEYGNGDSATDIANSNPEVSLIVAGHSHKTINGEKVGNATVVQPTNAGQGLGISNISVSKDEDGKYKVEAIESTVKSLKKADITEDAELSAALEECHEMALADAHSVIGTLSSDLATPNEIEGVPSSFIQDEGITDLINEVQLHYADKELKAKGVDPSKVHRVSSAAMLSATASMKAGDITKAGVAQIYKFDNTLYTNKTTGANLKKYMEWCCEYYNQFQDGDFNVSFGTRPAYSYDLFAGVKYDINISKEAGSRVENLTYMDGTPVKDNDEIYLTTNNYRFTSQLSASENPIFEPGTYEVICTSVNDEIPAIRDMITDYIVNEKGGKLDRKVDNNWKLTGVSYAEPLRSRVVDMLKAGELTLKAESTDKYGVVHDALTWEDVKAQLGEDSEEYKLLSTIEEAAYNVDVYSFNDFHGSAIEYKKNVGAAKLVGLIKSYQAKENDRYDVIPVSGGDMYQGSAISNVLYGEPESIMAKAMGLECSALGNHEFDWTTDLIPQWEKDGGFEFVAANIIDKATGKIVDYAQPYKIVEKNGVKVAFIGIATPETADKVKAENVAGITFTDPVEALEKYAPIAKAEGADVVIALTHCAAYQDSETKEITGEAADIAASKTVDAVIAAHNHAFVAGTVDGVPVVEGGSNGRGLAGLTISLNDKKEVTGIIPSVQKFEGHESELPVDAEVAEEMAKLQEKLAPMMNEVVTTLDEPLDHEGRYEGVTPLGVTVAETMRQLAGTQIGLTNGGGIRRTLEAGDVTVGDMYEILPFDNTLVTVNVTGAQLVKLLEHGINCDGMGWGQFAGIKVWYDAETGKVTSVRLNDGTKIEDTKTYSVTINDFMLTGGDKYDFSEVMGTAKDTGIIMRDAMAEYWKEKGVPELDYAILVAGKDETVDPQKPADPTKPTEPTKPDQKPSGDKLPQTGLPVSPDALAALGIMGIGLGAVIIKKRKVS